MYIDCCFPGLNVWAHPTFDVPFGPKLRYSRKRGHCRLRTVPYGRVHRNIITVHTAVRCLCEVASWFLRSRRPVPDRLPVGKLRRGEAPDEAAAGDARGYRQNRVGG
eukprot:COSAG02_NODE_18055_length_964_cov_0.919075_1_plen_106_part_01